MEIKYYIQVDEVHNIINSTCIVDDIVLDDDWILIKNTEWVNLSKYKKYNPINKSFYDEIIIIEQPNHEELSIQIHKLNNQIQDDTLLEIELNSDTNLKVTTTGDDSLLLMELMMSIDEKLTQLLQPKA